MDIDLYHESLGKDKKGQPVFLRDIWPTQQEVQDAIQKSIRSDMFRKEYGQVFQGDDRWNAMAVPEGDLYQWDAASTYVKNPPYFENMTPNVDRHSVADIHTPHVLPTLCAIIPTH